MFSIINKSSTPIGAWKCNFSFFLKEILSHLPTNRPTNRRTWKMIGKFRVPIISAENYFVFLSSHSIVPIYIIIYIYIHTCIQTYLVSLVFVLEVNWSITFCARGWSSRAGGGGNVFLLLCQNLHIFSLFTEVTYEEFGDGRLRYGRTYKAIRGIPIDCSTLS